MDAFKYHIFNTVQYCMNRLTRKHVFSVSDQVWHKALLGCVIHHSFFFCSLTEIVGTIYYHLIVVVLMRTHNLDYVLEQK